MMRLKAVSTDTINEIATLHAHFCFVARHRSARRLRHPAHPRRARGTRPGFRAGATPCGAAHANPTSPQHTGRLPALRAVEASAYRGGPRRLARERGGYNPRPLTSRSEAHLRGRHRGHGHDPHARPDVRHHGTRQTRRDGP